MGSSDVIRVSLLDASSEDVVYWCLITAVVAYSLIIGVFVATERCVRLCAALLSCLA